MVARYDKYAAESGEEVSQKPKTLSAVQLFAEAKEAEEGDLVMKKKIFELADNQLLVSRLCYEKLSGMESLYGDANGLETFHVVRYL